MLFYGTGSLIAYTKTKAVRLTKANCQVISQAAGVLAIKRTSETERE
jgi:hypothetical protein